MSYNELKAQITAGVRISALEVYQRVAQKSLKFLVGILGETMTSQGRHGEF